MKYFITLLVVSLSLYTCGQNKNNRILSNKNNKADQKMDMSKIKNEKVKQAIEALQSGDKSWYSLFTENPVMTDDGNQVDFKNFFSKALGKEKFITIDKVENNGREVYGNFKAGQWGTFKVFFKFHQNAEGKFDRLDIGQANY
ncbi:hypothetical protein [Terrimonas sp.]|uniref:hypothetical protein n=1 Tax=Terrimonas sp. TaxID=1914338 RepID=UPI00197E2634|nr:hypothetical protein [Terrimonas sp.]